MAKNIPLRLVTINVWSGLDYQGYLRVGDMESLAQREQRYQRLVNQLRRLEADIIAVQEVNMCPGYMERLASDLKFDQIHHPGLAGVRIGRWGLPTNLNEGDGLLARPQLGLQWVGRARLWGGYVGKHFSFNFVNATQVLAGRIRWQGRDVYLLCTHWSVAASASDYKKQTEGRVEEARQTLQRSSQIRQGEARRTLQWAERWVPPGAPTVFLGDLNAWPGSPELDLLKGQGWSDAWEVLHGSAGGHTWDPLRNLCVKEHQWTVSQELERVDYIWTNSVLGPRSVKNARLVLDEEEAGGHASDHFGLLVELHDPLPVTP